VIIEIKEMMEALFLFIPVVGGSVNKFREFEK
jgi:hypothetical protein